MYFRLNPDLEPFNAQWTEDKVSKAKNSSSTSAARTERRQGRHLKSLVVTEGASAVVSESDDDIDDHEDAREDQGREDLENYDSGPENISVLEESDVKDIKMPDCVIVETNEEMVSRLSLGWGESKVKLKDTGIQVDAPVNKEIRELEIVLDT